MSKIQKPFLKWVGGKTQIINSILDKIPREMENYHEPFLGGGSVLLGVLSLREQGILTIAQNIYAYDINETLIHVYKNIQNNKNELFEYITKYITTYDGLTGVNINRKPTTEDEALSSKESYYYWIRAKYNTMNKTEVECSALFLFLNKTCFRGMYREGPTGYNVPYGHYKKTPNMISRVELDTISSLIQDVTFVHCDFRNALCTVNTGDFVYLDPPYAPENTSSFVNYTADGFDLKSHYDLFDETKKIHNLNVKFIMSNANVELVKEAFEYCSCDEISARRAINSKNPASTTTELIIHN